MSHPNDRSAGGRLSSIAHDLATIAHPRHDPRPPDVDLSNPRTPGISTPLLSRLRREAATSTNFHRRTLIRRTLRRLAIIELTVQGLSRRDICNLLRCSPLTVTKWRARYRTRGLNAILDRLTIPKPRPSD